MNKDTTYQENSFKTKDLYEASVCYAMKLPLLDLEWTGKQCWFVFGSFERCKQLTDSYWRRDLVINAKDYADSVRSLKDRLFLKN